MNKNASTDQPIEVRVHRGKVVESRHLVDAVAADRTGHVVACWGDPDRLVIPRSAIKSLQAIPLVSTGAAGAYDVSREEIALACSSHSGEPGHVDAVERWLSRIDLSPNHLECGPSDPINADAARALLRSGETPAPIHNCCSGKHSGFLTTARHLDHVPAGYIDISHPVQDLVVEAMATLTTADLSAGPVGIDGCSIPVHQFELRELALGMARLVDPVDLDADLGEACTTIVEAQLPNAWWVAGTGRPEVEFAEAAGERLITKGGAEGVFMGALVDRGIGFALKCRDGVMRGADHAADDLLVRLGVYAEPALDREIRNRRNVVAGSIEVPGG